MISLLLLQLSSVSAASVAPIQLAEAEATYQTVNAEAEATYQVISPTVHGQWG